MITVNIKKDFGNFALDVELGFSSEFVALTGPNGSGKTTLLRVIAGLEKPDSGRIVVAGNTFLDDNVRLTPKERRVGYVFQDAALFPWLTVEKNIRFGLANLDADTDKGKFEEWIKELSCELGVDKLFTRFPKKLSGGEAQRVALARALAPKPEMLLLDEPFSAIDMEERPRLRHFVSTLQRKWGIPVILVTHDHAEVHTMADRLFRLENGKVVETVRKGELKVMPLVSY